MDAAQLGEDYRIEAAVERAPTLEPRHRADVQALPTPTGLSIFGWVVGPEPIEEVEIRAAGVRLIVPVDVPRPDVVEALGLGEDATPGFYSVIQPAGAGSERFEVLSLGAEDERVLLGTVVVTVEADPRSPSPLSWTPLIPPPEREKVLVGKDGWLFLIRDSNDVIGQQTGRVQLDEQAKREWKELLLRRLLATKRAATTWHTLVIPDKEIVYPEYLPEEIVPTPTRPVHEALKIAAAVEAPVSYALDALQAEKPRHNLYPRTDSHWNHRGSYVAYQLLCELVNGSGIGISRLEEEAIEWSEPTIAGGLGRKMHPPRRSPVAWASLRSHRSRLVFDNQVVNHGRVSIYEQDAPGPTCVLFGESFAQHLVLFLKESFRRLVYVHTSMLVDEILALEHPDAVVSLPVERFLIKVPDDEPGLSALAAAAARKAKRGTVAPEMAFAAAVPHAPGAGGEEQLGRMPWDAGDAG